MKKNISRLFTIAAISICIAFIQPQFPTPDYRDAYTGIYLCSRSCQSPVQALQSGSQTSSNMGTENQHIITISKDQANDSLLTISIGQMNFSVKLINNALYAYPPGRHWGGKFLANDSISFYSQVSLGSGLCSYRGLRQ